MDINRIANTDLDSASKALFQAASAIQNDTGTGVLGIFLLIRMLEEKGALDQSEMSIIADNMLDDLYNCKIETFKAIEQYIDNEII
jgi:hypothetical protein